MKNLVLALILACSLIPPAVAADHKFWQRAYVPANVVTTGGRCLIVFAHLPQIAVWYSLGKARKYFKAQRDREVAFNELRRSIKKLGTSADQNVMRGMMAK